MGEPWMGWVAFNLFVLAMLAIDLGVFHRKSHAVKMKEALGWSAVWITLALLFNLALYMGWVGNYAAEERGQRALEFLTGYLIEKSLSVDNIFVFLLIFTYFRVPGEYQHKVLFWGILGALVMRAIFIFAGVALMERFHWVIYVFGGFLIVTGIKMALEKDKEIHPERNPVLRLFRRAVPVTEAYEGDRFWVKRAGRVFATPLLVTLIFVEITDLIFAVDSIPAILAITTDRYIVYTSNVFAILGLRALYFALAGLMALFHYLHYGLAAILVFVGVKMVLAGAGWHFGTGISLGVILGILGASVVASWVWPRKEVNSEE